MENTPKILVVDDSALIVSLIEKVLKENGYQVIKAYDGEEALSKVSDEKPDIIILDIIMPKIDGLEVLRRLKSNKETSLIPVVMLTSDDYLEDKIKGFKSGADDYIIKPFNTKELLARINSLVDKRIYLHKKVEDEKREALESIVDGVAHEVRNPILAIGGFARRIRDKLPPGDTLKIYTDHIIHEAERLETMVNEIINLKTITVSAHKPVDLKETLEDALKNFNDSINKKKISVKRKYSNEIPLIMGDRKNLNEAFSNVIKNAIEAMDLKGTLTLGIEFDSSHVIIKITDSGKGIAKSQLPHVFRPFYTSKMTGAGMGLALVNHIIFMHGGDVNISSTEGMETCVDIVLPIRENNL
jgi:signal transduction histidine kinase